MSEINIPDSSMTIDSFIEDLRGIAPAPGGGGAMALCGAVAAALGNMAGSLTVGKKKYADVQDEILELNLKAASLQNELLSLISKDAEVFVPLSKAYGMPADTDEQRLEKERVLEEALMLACSVPIRLVDCCCETIDLCARVSEICSRLVVSDAGCGAILAKAALSGAVLNIYVNTKLMKNKETAAILNADATMKLEKYGARAQQVYDCVASGLKVC